jgi:DNA-binding MarR family transcriptional regulator
MDIRESRTIIEKLDLLVRLKVTELIIGRSFLEQVALLSQAGMGPKEIAEAIGKTPNNVSVALNSLKKKTKKG